MRRLAVLVTTPPGARTDEAIRTALATTASHEVSVLFLGDGILSALRLTPPSRDFEALRTGAKLYAELESLGAGAPADGVLPLLRPKLGELLHDADLVVGF